MAVGDTSTGPLAGVRILELARIIAGPYATRVLADLGAEVVKVEPPEGDGGRVIGPKHDLGMSWLYTFSNAGKRSIAIDLGRREGVDLVLALAKRADVVIENFRPGVADEIGVGFAAVHASNPRCVYVSVNGYGKGSALAHRRAYAPVMHAVTGILHDQAEYTDQPPAQLNDARADTVTALHAAIALLATLRSADATGVGQHVEVPMFDAVLSTYTETGIALMEAPDDRVMNPIYDAGRHGAIAAAGSEPHIWKSASRHLGLADPAPPGCDIPTKARTRRASLETWMAGQPSIKDVLAGLEASGLACAPVQSLRDALTGPLARERELLVHVDDRRGGTRPIVRPPARLSGSENRNRGPAPRLGEHTRDILRDWLDYDGATVDALEADGVLAVRPAAPH